MVVYVDAVGLATLAAAAATAGLKLPEGRARRRSSRAPSGGDDP